MSVLMTTRNALSANTDDRPARPPFSVANGKLMRLREAQPTPEQHVLAVEFRSPEGRRWDAIGGGATVADAITWARESCPDGVTWSVVCWNDLYGR